MYRKERYKDMKNIFHRLSLICNVSINDSNKSNFQKHMDTLTNIIEKAILQCESFVNIHKT